MLTSSDFIVNLIIEIVLAAGLVLTTSVYIILWSLLPKTARCWRDKKCWTQKAWLLIMMGNGILGIVFLASSIALLSDQPFYGLYGMFFMRILMLIMLLSTTLMVVSSLIKDFAEIREIQDFMIEVKSELADYDDSIIEELQC